MFPKGANHYNQASCETDSVMACINLNAVYNTTCESLAGFDDQHLSWKKKQVFPGKMANQSEYFLEHSVHNMHTLIVYMALTKPECLVLDTIIMHYS